MKFCKSFGCQIFYTCYAGNYQLDHEASKVLFVIFSQPPLLSSMIHEIYQRTGDINLIKKALPALIKEHGFWNSGAHNLTFFCFFLCLLFSAFPVIFCLYWLLLLHYQNLLVMIGVHKVTIRDSEGCSHNLSRYYAMWNKPRPESATMVFSIFT